MKTMRLCLFGVVALLVMAAACSRFSNRGIVEAPLIGSANTSNLSFTQIELTDSSTVLQGVIHFQPGWWVRLAPTSEIRAGGVGYAMQSVEGIALGERVVMPDSGVIHFTMTFPPIPADAKSIDFSENSDNGWEVWDIDLTGDAGHDVNVKGVPSKARKDDGRVMPSTELAYGDSAVINIHILGYKPAMGNKLTWVANTLHGQIGADTPATVDENGNAVVKLSLSAPADFIVVSLDKGVSLGGDVFVAPGENLNVYVDAHISGIRNMNVRDKNEGGFPKEYSPVYSDGLYPRLRRKIAMQLYSGDFGDYHWSGDEYTAYILDTYKALTDSIDSDVTLSEADRRYSKACLTGDLISATSDARSLLRRNYYFTNNVEWGTPIPGDSIRMTLSPDNIKAVAAVIDFNDKDLLLSPEVSHGNMDVAIWEEAGVDPGLLKTLSDYKRAYSAAQNGELTPSAKGDLSGVLAEEVEAHNAAVIADIEAMGTSLLTPTPEVPADKVFDAIVAPHKGKVVMVDLWNTWCAPCRAAIAAMEPEKKGDLSSDDIVWIYIANQTSPRHKYLHMIKDIQGIHYRVEENEWKSICDRFGVDGIPFYILVDRDGKAVARPDLRDHDLYKKTLLEKVSLP